MARTVLLIFSISTVILAIASIFHLFGVELSEVAQGRATALEYNAGTLGVLMALSLVILIGLHLNAGSKDYMSHIPSLALTFPLLTVMVNTGSRGALAALIIGCLVYLLPILNFKLRLTAIIIAGIGIVATIYIAAQNPDYSSRWEQTYYQGNVSGRDQIYSAAIEMARERPVFGWHPVLHWHELGLRVGEWERDEHSLFLHLLLEVGLVGTVPFLVGIWLCGKAAWKARKGELGSLPLALMFATLTANVTDTFIARKPLWLVLALTLAAASGGVKGKAIGVRVTTTR
jgi:O-antigen ligase